MQNQFGVFAKEEAGARHGDDLAGNGVPPPRPAAPEWLSPPKRLGAAADGGAELPGTHTIRLTSAYGELVAMEEVPDCEFGAALRRFHDRAVSRANAVVVIDGITHTRNAFLAFVREFKDCAARHASVRA
jgi:hypothetical protein